MYSEEPTNSWATVEDLTSRYGQEYIDKLSTRTVYDADVGSYVADETSEGRFRVLSLALSDAKELIKRKVSCIYSNSNLLENNLFPALKQWHIKLTIETLKIGGDCSACACNEDLDKFLSCGNICTEDGQCLTSNKTFWKVSKADWPCEGGGCC